MFGILPLSLLYLNGRKYTEIEDNYLLGIVLSLVLRITFFAGSLILGFNDAKFILVLCFFIMAIFFTFERIIKRRIKAIEKTLL